MLRKRNLGDLHTQDCERAHKMKKKKKKTRSEREEKEWIKSITSGTSMDINTVENSVSPGVLRDRSLRTRRHSMQLLQDSEPPRLKIATGGN